MCRNLFFGITLLITSIASAQKLDLIVTSNGTAIACKIDSITNTEIYFKLKSNGNNWIQIIDNIDNVTSYKYDFIDRKNYIFKNGTSIIDTEAKSHSFNKNAVCVSAGTLLVYFSAIGFYERIVSKKESDFLNSKAFARLGFGGYTSWGDEGTFLLPQFGFLTGAHNSHLEVAAGIYFTRRDSDISVSLPLSGAIGYRYQKPEGNFIGRIGLGFPEAIYLSFGFSF